MLKQRRVLLEKLSIPLISIVILGFLFLQAGETFRVFCPWKCAPSFWPFMDYPMYDQSHYAGEKIDQVHVIGLLDDSTEVEINYRDFGLNSLFKMELVVRALVEHDLEQLAVYIKTYDDTHPGRLAGLRLENSPLVLTKEGTKAAQAEVWAEFRVDELEEMVQ